MHIGDWLTLGVAAILVGFLMYWRLEVWRQYMPPPRKRHSNAHRAVSGDDAARIQNGGQEGTSFRGISR